MTDNPLIYPGAAHPDLREPMIAELVRTFYARAREDKLIGPVFAAAVADWDHHIGKITDFWSGVMLRTGRYDGRQMRPHLILPLEGKHFGEQMRSPEALNAFKGFLERKRGAEVHAGGRLADAALLICYRYGSGHFITPKP